MQENIFYHIHKKGIQDDKWKVGSILETSQNEFTNLSFSFSAYLNIYNKENVPLSNAIEYAQEIRDVFTQLDLLSISKVLISEYQILIRELAFEDVRQKSFKDLPSRQNCIWLCRKDQLSYWEKNMGCTDYTIYEIEIYNKPFKSRNTLIPLPSESYNVMRNKAEKYWQYKNNDICEDDEYLYEGKFKILGSI